MDSDFRPANRPKSLQAKLDNLQETPKPQNQNFQTPEEVAVKDDLTAPVQNLASMAVASSNKRSKRAAWRDKFHFSWPPGKKEWIGSVITVLVCGGIVALVLTHVGPKPVTNAQPIQHVAKKVAPKPTTVPSTLSGLPVDPSVNQRPVTGVMIENSPDARPQSGLSQASVVFEAIAEGGVTRFLALYQDTAPANIGPVRSARPYYIQWALGFDAAYAHVGGSPDGLADIKAWGVKDLDEFYNAGAYHRISSRVAPHNVYTSIATLNQLEASKGYATSSYTGFVRKKPAPVKVPTAKTIDITMSGPLYNAHYDYNAVTNTYNRSEGGAPHIDANTNQQISPNVVVALVMPYSLGALDTSGAYYSVYNTIGSGQAFIFQDGTLTTGTWTKTDAKSQFSFTDANGKPIGLNPGQTWLTAVGSSSKVVSAP
ncbi:MAG TPA: DUF3048 domain-containing protein [Candidatus Saccharimonadales bacterium]|jgi:hypothetical protein|nr:DUF3048 domain-containing protein [Candidatus Saccharimonadales bacterium]